MLPELTDNPQGLRLRALSLLKGGKTLEVSDEDGTTTLHYSDREWWLQRMHYKAEHKQYDCKYILEDDHLAQQALERIMVAEYEDETSIWQAVLRRLV